MVQIWIIVPVTFPWALPGHYQNYAIFSNHHALISYHLWQEQKQKKTETHLEMTIIDHKIK